MRAGERSSYVKFLDVVRSMGPGYDRRYQQLKDILSSDRETRTASPSATEICVKDVEEHLRDLCRNLSETMDNLGLSSLDDDVRSCSIPLQAIKEQDAEPIMALEQQLDQQRVMDRRAHQHSRRGGVHGQRVRPERADEGKTFCLKDARQLLMRDPCAATATGSAGGGGRRSSSGTAAAAAAAQACKLEQSCMLLGGAGQGKTTVCKRVLAEVVDADDAGDLARFRFVFYVPCRDVERVTSADWSVLLGLDDVAAALDLTELEKAAVLKHVSRHSDEVLIILDGIDEAGADGFCRQSAALTALAKRGRNNRLPHATVIATSRPCRKAHALLATCRVRYRLRGFSDDQLRAYCCRQLGDGMGERCMQQLAEPANCALKEAASRTPLLSALLCDHYKRTCATSGPSMPSSISAFYTKFMCSAVAKLESRRDREFGHVKLARDFSSHMCGGRVFQRGELVDIATVLDYQLEGVTEEGNCPEAMELVKALRDLYSLCASCISKGDAWLPSDSLPSAAMFMCESLGLLAAPHTRATGVKRRFSLVHLTMQEWCASRAMASADAALPAIADCARHIGASEDTWVFWRFLFGALKEDLVCDAIDMLKCLETNASAGQKKRTLLFLMRCLYENQQSLHEDIYSVECDCSVADRYVPAAQLLAKGGIRLGSTHLDMMDMLAIRNVLQLVGYTTELEVSSCGLTLDHITLLSPVLDKAATVNLANSDLSGAPLASIAAELSCSQTPHLRILDLRDCKLGNSDEDGATLARCVQLPSLSQLSVTGPRLGNRGLSSFASSLLSCDHLTHLSFAACSLGRGSGRDLAKVVTKLPALQYFWLHDNSLANGDVIPLLGALKSHRNICRLSLEMNRLDDDLTSDLIGFFQARRAFDREKSAGQPAFDMCLPKCSTVLSSNDISSCALHRIASAHDCSGDVCRTGSHRVTGKHLCKVERETVPELYESSSDGYLNGMLHDCLMSELGQHLARSTDISQLMMRMNRITDAGATTLSRAGLADNSSLRFLNLGNNRFHVAGALAVLEALASPKSEIQALVLDTNPLFSSLHPVDAECRLLLEQLPQCRHLRFISLSSTGMADEIGASVLQSLKHHRNIKWIDLDKNEVGDRTARALVKMMEVNRSLRIVGLFRNCVTDAGVRELLASVHVMAMEGVYLGSNPGICSPGALRPPLRNALIAHSDYDVLEFIGDFPLTCGHSFKCRIIV